ncbi:MAG: hypothetical protein JRJ25_08795 [Deltaproteobacteria bacterium]|nr:hypothetical protein [Deltaproteobacteria bacterium]
MITNENIRPWPRVFFIIFIVDMVLRWDINNEKYATRRVSTGIAIAEYRKNTK